MIKNVAEFIKQIHGWEFPISPEKICSKLNIQIERKDLPQYIKSYYTSDTKTITINSTLDKYKSRMAIAMEIRQSQSKEILRVSEKEQFGIELLMPTSEFIKVWSESAPAEVMECSIYFDVSPNMVISRVKYLHRKRFLQPKIHKNLSDII